jgi:hypothetical protein
MQNLVILSFALQSNLSFYMHGNPVQPQLDSLNDELELRVQALPGAEVWQEATRRAKAILEVMASPLLNAANVAQFVDMVRRRAEQCCQDVERLCHHLRRRLEVYGIEARTASRLQTVQTTLALLSDLVATDKDEIVTVLARADIATSDTAMKETITQAATLVHALVDQGYWELFEKLSLLPAERVPQAQDIVATVKELLTRDEHVVPLVETLQKMQSVALDMLTKAVEAPPPAPSRVAAPIAPPPPSRAREVTTSSRRGLSMADALVVFDTIRQELEANPDIVLDIDWRLSPKHGNAS